jgi:hypothetical protein
MRSKTAWEVQKDERTGKTKPVKIGLAPVQRDGLEYEFSVVLDLSLEGHVATASKDRTSLFDNQYFVPSVETGKHLQDWLSKEEKPLSSQQYMPSPFDIKEDPVNENQACHSEDLFSKLRELGLGDRIKEYDSYVVNKYGYGFKDMDQGEIQELYQNLRRCEKDPELREKFKDYLDRFRTAA